MLLGVKGLRGRADFTVVEMRNRSEREKQIRRKKSEQPQDGKRALPNRK
jgi:hypothetical protein